LVCLITSLPILFIFSKNQFFCFIDALYHSLLSFYLIYALVFIICFHLILFRFAFYCFSKFDLQHQIVYFLSQ
jgi:hypothetical protein